MKTSSFVLYVSKLKTRTGAKINSSSAKEVRKQLNVVSYGQILSVESRKYTTANVLSNDSTPKILIFRTSSFVEKFTIILMRLVSNSNLTFRES